METNDYIQANRASWNETAHIHAAATLAELEQRVPAAEFTTFDAVEREVFARIGLAGKAVVQLGCNNGRELIAVKKAGAGRCIGVDVSDEFIAQAQHLAGLSGVEVTFLRASVYDLPAGVDGGLDGQFDLVYVTIGVLGCLPDLDGFWAIVARLLKPGGQLFLYDMHPILNLFDAETGLEVRRAYFQQEPIVEENVQDYMDPTQTIAATAYWFPHTMGDVVGGCLRHGLSVTFFEEYEHDLSMVFAAFEGFEHRLPLSYALVAVNGWPTATTHRLAPVRR